MCDLFGLSCNEEDRATKSLPIFQKKFGTHETNPHGWGIAYFDNNGVIVKKASDGSEFAAAENKEFRKTVDKARSKNIIAHLRHKSGETDVCELNCHPFEYHYHGRDWIFAHNGFVSNDFDRHPDAKGTTDSETIFQKMMGYVDEHMRSGSIRGLYPAMKKAVRQILDDFPGIKLNFLMSDGNMYYVFSHYYRQPPCNARRPKPMYIQRNSKGYGNAILLSTQNFGDGNWEKIPEDTLLVLNCGEVIVRSDPI
jgi:glutamine amidotransferase